MNQSYKRFSSDVYRYRIDTFDSSPENVGKLETLIRWASRHIQGFRLFDVVIKKRMVGLTMSFTTNAVGHHFLQSKIWVDSYLANNLEELIKTHLGHA